VAAKPDEQDVRWTRRRRPGRPAQPAVRRPEGPRFDRFAVAMDEARASGAPETTLYCDPEPGAPAPEAPRPARYPSAGVGRRRLVPSYARRVALRASLPGRATLLWLGAAGGILLVSVLLAHWAIRSDLAETAQLFGRHFGEALSGPVEPEANRSPPALTAPEARSDEGSPPAQATPPSAEALLAQAAALQPPAGPPPPAIRPPAASKPLDPAGGFPPRPQFKPTAAGG
jgi:hypothetical protein